MRHALCLQHVDFEGPGIFRDLLAQHHYNLRTCLVPVDGLPSNPTDFLLIMGGPMSANETNPWIIKEMEFIRETVRCGIPVLGVCLGAQLLAKGLGATVSPGTHMELGAVPITITPDGQQDPVFSTFPTTLEVFQWHSEGCNLPEGAVALASSELYSPQAFRFETQVYGLLFHLELESSGIKALCQKCPNDVQRHGTTLEVLVTAGKKLMAHSYEWADRLIAYMARN